MTTIHVDEREVPLAVLHQSGTVREKGANERGIPQFAGSGPCKALMTDHGLDAQVRLG